MMVINGGGIGMSVPLLVGTNHSLPHSAEHQYFKHKNCLAKQHSEIEKTTVTCQ